MNIEITGHNLRHVSTFGSQHIAVDCVAHLTNMVANRYRIDYGKYNIEYYRDPISGNVRGVKCQPVPEEETNENTLTTEAVEGYVMDFLQ